MHISLAVVTSADGRTTRGDVVHESAWMWSSGDDKEFFTKLRDEHDAIIFGRQTYEAQKQFITLSPDVLRIVMTSTPNAFKHNEVPGQLEFTNESPTELVARLERAGIKSVLLVSGSTLSGPFIDAHLVQVLYQTIEPRVFGSGKGIADIARSARLRLLESRQLGTHGTIILKYEFLTS